MADIIVTNRDFYSAVISAQVSPAVTEFAETALAKMDEKNAKRRVEGSKTAQANVALKSAIVAKMEPNVVYTAAEIVAFGIDGVNSTQKVTPLMKQIVEAGQATATDVKIKGKSKVKGYALVVSE